MMRCFIFFILPLLLLSACAMQRAVDAETAQRVMLNMHKDAVFACMGIPKKKMTEGKTTIWLYKSTDGYSTQYKAGGASGALDSIDLTLGLTHSVKKKRFCAVQIVMQKDHVVAVNYNGPTGGFLTDDEQCAYAVRNCLPH